MCECSDRGLPQLHNTDYICTLTGARDGTYTKLWEADGLGSIIGTLLVVLQDPDGDIVVINADEFEEFFQEVEPILYTQDLFEQVQ